jgi:hypothetical protein
MENSLKAVGRIMPAHTEIGEFIWRIADHLRGDYEKNDNEDVILPLATLKLARRPRLLTASLAALPSMSLIPFAPFSLWCSTDDVPGMSRMFGEC